MLQYKLPIVLQDSAHRRGGEIVNKVIGNAQSTLAGIRIFFTKIEAYAGMSERLVRDLVIEEALQTKIKETL